MFSQIKKKNYVRQVVVQVPFVLTNFRSAQNLWSEVQSTKSYTRNSISIVYFGNNKISEQIPNRFRLMWGNDFSAGDLMIVGLV